MARQPVSIRSAPVGPRSSVLVACVDAAYASTLSRYLTGEGYQVQQCTDSKGVLRLAGRTEFDVAVLDLELSKDGGVDLVSFVRRRNPRTRIIILFDITQIDRALEGLRQGAYFYLPNSCVPSDVALAVGKAVRSIDHEATVDRIQHDMVEEMMGESPQMRRIIEIISKVAPTDSTVLLLGESGTGKEVLSGVIHRLSPRRDMPFIAINCAALPDQLLESEMFGHVKGSFTGADSDKRGLFEEADGGTIFLDEIGDMALVTQAKLLRVLQNGEIRSVGDTKAKRVDVRIIAATNRDLERAVATNAFREDLYFRLNVIQIRIPPLRERVEALPKLVRHFLGRFNQQFNKQIDGVDEQAQGLLRNYSFPGNVRELESIIAHAVIMCDGNLIRASDLPDQVAMGVRPQLALPSYVEDEVPSLNDMESRLIRLALDRLDGNQTEAAKKLGVSRSTLWRKMKEYGIAR